MLLRPIANKTSNNSASTAKQQHPKLEKKRISNRSTNWMQSGGEGNAKVLEAEPPLGPIDNKGSPVEDDPGLEVKYTETVNPSLGILDGKEFPPATSNIQPSHPLQEDSL
ncbi:hypothetical protein U1Q18_003312 [Sarracenia purpurea var. burkii]